MRTFHDSVKDFEKFFTGSVTAQAMARFRKRNVSAQLLAWRLSNVKAAPMINKVLQRFDRRLTNFSLQLAFKQTQIAVVIGAENNADSSLVGNSPTLPEHRRYDNFTVVSRCSSHGRQVWLLLERLDLAEE